MRSEAYGLAWALSFAPFLVFFFSEGGALATAQYIWAPSR